MRRKNILAKTIIKLARCVLTSESIYPLLHCWTSSPDSHFAHALLLASLAPIPLHRQMLSVGSTFVPIFAHDGEKKLAPWMRGVDAWSCKTLLDCTLHSRFVYSMPHGSLLPERAPRTGVDLNKDDNKLTHTGATMKCGRTYQRTNGRSGYQRLLVPQPPIHT